MEAPPVRSSDAAPTGALQEYAVSLDAATSTLTVTTA